MRYRFVLGRQPKTCGKRKISGAPPKMKKESQSTPAVPVALTIAGFDPSSGAGITADLKTFSAHGIYGVACISAMTVQSTLGVRAVEPLPAILRHSAVSETGSWLQTRRLEKVLGRVRS